jgi:hypothetical protein
MRIVRKGINPVKLPFPLKTNHPILASWANEVRTSIQQLRDRIPTVGGGFSGGGVVSHPWRASSAGASSVNISAGCALGVRSPGTSRPWYCTYVQYAGGAVTIGATGFVYAVIEVDTTLIGPGVVVSGTDILSRTMTPTSVSVKFSAEDPDSVDDGTGDEVWIPIAEVGITDGVAVVVTQILTHNPMIPIEEVVGS